MFPWDSPSPRSGSASGSRPRSSARIRAARTWRCRRKSRLDEPRGSLDAFTNQKWWFYRKNGEKWINMVVLLWNMEVSLFTCEKWRFYCEQWMVLPVKNVGLPGGFAMTHGLKKVISGVKNAGLFLLCKTTVVLLEIKKKSLLWKTWQTWVLSVKNVCLPMKSWVLLFYYWRWR